MSDLGPILDLPRWQPLRRFVERWNAEPLGASGVSEEEIAAVEARLAFRLPQALREWYLLVGHRFADTNQDRPVPLARLALHRGRLPIWWENQGNWSFDVTPDDPDDDPWAIVDGGPEPYLNRRERLSRALLGMVYSDTLVGAGSDHGDGILGPLHEDVVGGYSQDIDERRLRERTLPLDVAPHPNFDEPLRGHDALVLRHDGFGCQWMAVGEAATAEIHALAATRA